MNRKPQLNFAIKAKTKLLERGLTVTQLAGELGFARNTVSIAINHPSMLPTVKAAITRHLELAA